MRGSSRSLNVFSCPSGALGAICIILMQYLGLI